MLHEELTRSIIGASMTVRNNLKPGLDEKLYERALKIELGKRGHVVEAQRAFPAYHDGQEIGTLIPDPIVDGLVLVDTEVAKAFNDSHEARMIGYPAITGLQIGLIINFRYRSLKTAPPGPMTLREPSPTPFPIRAIRG